MPSVSLPVLAIREANEHLQALFLENQKLESQVEELSSVLKQTRDDNIRLNEYVKSVNERVLKLGQEHIENLNTLRESLNAENHRRISDVQRRHQKKLQEQEEVLKAEGKKRITDLQVKLKSEEKKKLNQLQKTLDEERSNVSALEDKIQKLNEHLLENTNRREEKIVLLNNVFKSTIENMSLCLSITGEHEFIRSHGFVSENNDGDKDASEAFSGKFVYDTSSQNSLNLGSESDDIRKCDSGVQDVRDVQVVGYQERPNNKQGGKHTEHMHGDKNELGNGTQVIHNGLYDNNSIT